MNSINLDYFATVYVIIRNAFSHCILQKVRLSDCYNYGRGKLVWCFLHDIATNALLQLSQTHSAHLNGLISPRVQNLTCRRSRIHNQHPCRVEIRPQPLSHEWRCNPVQYFRDSFFICCKKHGNVKGCLSVFLIHFSRSDRYGTFLFI